MEKEGGCGGKTVYFEWWGLGDGLVGVVGVLEGHEHLHEVVLVQHVHVVLGVVLQFDELDVLIRRVFNFLVIRVLPQAKQGIEARVLGLDVLLALQLLEHLSLLRQAGFDEGEVVLAGHLFWDLDVSLDLSHHTRALRAVLGQTAEGRESRSANEN